MTPTQINGASDPDRSDPGLDAAPTLTNGRAPTLTQSAPTPTAPTPDPTADPTRDPDPGQGRGSGQVAHLTPTPDPTSDPATPGKIGTGSGSDQTDDQTPTSDQTPTDKKRTHHVDWIAVGMWSVIILLNVLALALASSGQIDGTWHWAGLSGDDARKWLLPAITEVGYIGFLLLGADALRREQSPFIWWACAGTVAAAAVFMNSVHGDPGFKVRQGLIFGIASAVSLAMTFAKFLIDYRSYRRKQGHTSGLRPRAITLGSIRFLRTALRASLIIARCEQVKTKQKAYELAETWRWIYQDVKAKHGRGTAKRAAWIAIYRRLGMPVPDLNNILVPEVTFSVAPPTPEPIAAAEPQPAITGTEPTFVPSTIGTTPPPSTRRRVTATPTPVELPADDEDEPQVDVLEPGRPGGTRGANWMSVEAISVAIQFDDEGKKLPVRIDPLPADLARTTCRCHATKPCGKSVLDHVERRGQHLAAVMRLVPDWATREKPVTLAEVMDAIHIPSKGPRVEIKGLFEHLREMVQQQAAAQAAGRTIDAVPLAIEAPPDDMS